LNVRKNRTIISVPKYGNTLTEINVLALFGYEHRQLTIDPAVNGESLISDADEHKTLLEDAKH
jgi:hypothetical protein